ALPFHSRWNGTAHLLAWWVSSEATLSGGTKTPPRSAPCSPRPWKSLPPVATSSYRTLRRRHSAYVSRVGLAPLEAVALVREHGGVPSLAHPGTVEGLERLLPQLVRAGLVGIECYYPSHTPA